jgi:hypothetical protein
MSQPINTAIGRLTTILVAALVAVSGAGAAAAANQNTSSLSQTADVWNTKAIQILVLPSSTSPPSLPRKKTAARSAPLKLVSGANRAPIVGVVLGASTGLANTVTQEQMQAAIRDAITNLRNSILQSSPNSGGTVGQGQYSSGGYTNNLALTNRIDQLSGTTLTNVVINSVSGLKAADIPDLSSNYLTVAAAGNAANGLFSSNVGIGTSSPSSALSVQGGALFSGDIYAANVTATGTVSSDIVGIKSSGLSSYDAQISATRGGTSINHGIFNFTSSGALFNSYDGTPQFGIDNTIDAAEYWTASGGITNTGATLLAGNGTLSGNVSGNFAATGIGGFNWWNGSGQLFALGDPNGAVTNWLTMYPGTSTGNPKISSPTSIDLDVPANSAERFTFGGVMAAQLTQAGFGIGTSSPDTLLSVSHREAPQRDPELRSDGRLVHR